MSDGRRPRARWRIGIVGVLVAALSPIGIDNGWMGAPAGAEIIAPFVPAAFSTNAPGAIDIVGNGLMTCPASANCTNALAGTANLSNNNFSMIWNDSDDGVLPAAISNQTTTSSSFANLTLPGGSTVLYASLHWSANSNSASRDEIDLYVPGTAGYQTITGSLEATGSLYQATADITALVQAGGSGDYWAGDTQGLTGGGRYSAWSMVVVYENPGLPVRNLTVFDGFGRVRSNESIDVPISGFITPPFGPVNAEIGVVAYEGDLRFTGDQLLIDTDGGGTGTGMQNLTDASNPITNFGNNSISDAGVNTTPGGIVNNLNVDIDEFATTNLLDNGQTNSTVRFSTTGDWWYPGVLTTAIDLFVPEFPDAVKTVTDLNGGDALPGDVLEYSMAILNVGNDAAVDSIVTDAIPANTSFVAGSLLVDGVAQTDAANTGATDYGDFTGSAIVARIGAGANGTSGGTLNPDDSATVTFRVTIDESASGTSIPNAADISYTADTLDEDFTFRTNEVHTPVPPRANLSIDKTGSPNPAVPGEDVTWTITIDNAGPNPATGVTLSDSLTNNTFVSAAGASCTGTTSLTCDVPDIPVGGTAIVTITASTDPSLDPAATVSDTATVRADEDDADPTDNSASAALPVEAEADLSIVKTDDADPVTPNSTLTYTLTVSNAGPSDATDVVIVDGLPGGVTVVDVSSPDTLDCSVAGRTCTVPVIAAGDSASMEVEVTVDSATVGPLTNAAKTGSDATDPNPANNSTSEDTDITPVADIGVDKTTLDAPLVAGETVQYRIRVDNAGPSTAENVTLTDLIDTDLDLISAAPTQGSCAGDPSVSCSLGSIGAGGFVDVVITAMVDAGASGTDITNTASATTSTDEPLGGGNANSDSVTDTVANSSDLRIVKTVDQNPIVAGGTFEYTLTVVNDGPSDTDGTITVTDAVPDPLVPDTVSGGCSIGAGDVVTCSSAAVLEVGDSIVFTISGTVPAAASTPSVENTASVTYTGTDPNSDNNEATAETDLDAEADVLIDKEWSTATATAGETAEFTLTVTNEGPSVASGVSITDSLPGGLTVVSASGAGVTCGPAGTSNLSCAADADLGVDDSLTVTVVAAVPDTLATGQLDNTGSVTATTPDRNPSNNDDVDSIDIVREADLVVAKTADNDAPVAGETVEYTVVVTNNGPSTANGTFVGDPLPSTLTLQGVPATSQGTCANVAGAISCDLGVIEVGVGGAVTITYTVVVDPSAPPGADLVNSVSASSTDPDPTPAESSETVAPVGEADLTVTKAASISPAVPGGPLTYTITVSNAGPSDALDVVLSDPPPAGFTVTAADSSIGTCDLTVSCEIGTIPVDSLVTITIEGTLDSGFAGATLTNTTDPVESSTTLIDTGDDSGTITVGVAPQADLAVTKAASPTTIDAGGGPVTYTISVSNSGPSDAADVDITETLPPGFVVDSVTPSQGTCPSDTLCELGTVVAGAAPATIVVVGHYPSSEAAGLRTNTASAASSTTLTNTDDDSDTADVALTRSADVAISKSGPIEATAGTSIQYQLAVTNNGPSDASGVTVTDVLDAALLDAAGATVSISPAAAGTCSNTAGTIGCTLGDVAVGDLVLIIVEVDVLSGAPAGTDNLSNTADVDASTDDPDSDNDSSTLTTDVLVAGDISVVKTGPVGFVAGQAGDYTITVTNDGPSDATGVVIDDPTPTGMTFGAISSVPNVCTALPCAIGDLAVDDSVVITISATVDPDSTATSVENTATATSASPDGNPSNDVSTIDTPITSDADMELVSKTDDVDPVAAGANVVYTITAQNDGPSTAVDAVITDIVPANTTLVTASLPAGCTTTGTAPGSTITCDLGTLAPTETAARSLEFTVDPGVTPPTIISNTASTSSTTPDSNTTNDDATEATTVGVEADLGIVKAADLTTAVPGEALTYTLTITNGGPSTAVDVTVTDAIAAIFASGSVSSDLVGAPAGAVCDTTVSCSVPSFPVGSFDIEITGTVEADITAALNNIATVAAADPSEGPDALPNSASLGTPVAPSADLRIAKSADPALLLPGGSVQYTITVTNDGPSDAQNVTISDSLPTDITPAAPTAIATAAVGATCDQGALSCTIPTIAAGSSITITVDGTVSDRAVDSVDNTADIDSSDTPDPDPSDDSVTITTPVDPRADVSVAKTTLTSPVVAGETVRWRIDVVNDGPATAENVTVVDSLPIGVSFVNASPAVGSCTHDSGEITCLLGDLGDQASVPILVDVLVGPGTSGSLDNDVSASTDTVDPDGSNDDAATSDTVVIAPDLRVDKILVPADPADADLVAGEEFEYEITITNDGPSTALADVVLADTLPPEVSDASPVEAPARAVVLSDTTNCSYTDATNQISCTFADDLAVGDSITLTVTGFIRTDAVAVADNTVTVTTTDDDPDLTNNTSTAEADLVTNADLATTKVFDDASVIAGQTTTFTITTTNNGPSVAADAELVDNLPAGWTVSSIGSASGGVCTNTATSVTCTNAALAVNATISVEITALVGASHPAGPVTNTAVASSATPDRNPDNDDAVDGIEVSRLAGLTVNKAASSGAALAGEEIEYTVTITSDGPSSAELATIGDVLPDEVDLVPGSIEIDGAAPVAPQSCTAPGDVLVCQLGDMAPGDSYEITYTVLVLSTVADDTTVTNTASGETITPLDEPAVDDSDVDIATQADVELVSKTVTPDPLIAGSDATYTITVRNNGPSIARSTVVTDALPASLTPVVASLPTGCSVVSGNDIECALGTLAVDEVVELDIVVTVDAAVLATDTIENDASVVSEEPDPVDNNTGSVETDVDTVADVSIAKTASPAPVVPGESVVYTLVITNAGPSVARDVTVSDPSPAGVTFTDVDNGTCDLSLACNLGDLPVGTTTIVIDADIAPEVAASISNTATVATATDEGADAGANSSTAVSALEPTADLAIAKTLMPNPPVPGELVTYTITVTNPGPSASQNVVITDTLDPAIAGLATLTPGCSITDSELECTIATLSPGSFVATITGTLDEAFLGELTNTAGVTTDTPQGPNTSSDTATASGTAAPSADLDVTKAASPNPVIAGEALTYTITVTNEGPSTALGVAVDDPLPAGFSLDAVESSQGDCTDLPCAIGTLADGESATVTIDGFVDSDVVDLPANIATASSSTPDPESSNDSGTSDPVVETLTDLVVGKTLTLPADGTAVPGLPVQWQITLGNDGPSDALDVELTDIVPAAVVDVVVSSAPVGCTTLPCTVGTLASGDSIVVTVDGTLSPDAVPGTLSNTATVTSSTPEDDEDSNTSTAADPIVPEADLRIEKAGPPAVTPGAEFTYTLTVTNDGPSDAADIVVTDTLPAAYDSASIVVSADDATCTVTGSDVECTQTTLAADGTSVIEISATVLSDYAGDSVSNTAEVDAATADPDLSDNTSTAVSDVAPVSDLIVTKTGPTAAVAAGEAIVWEIVVLNDGPSTAPNVVVTDALPSVIDPSSVVVDSDSSTCTIAGLSVECERALLPVGSSISITVEGVIVPDADIAALANTVTAASDNPDDVVDDNSAEASTPVANETSLAAVKRADVSEVEFGGEVVYTIEVTNAGPSTAFGVTVTDDLPIGLTARSAAATPGSCTISAATTVECGPVDIGPDETVVVTIAATAEAAGDTENIAVVECDCVPDTIDTNAVGVLVADPDVDLVLAKTVSSETADVGEAVSFTIEVENEGTDTATNVVVDELMPVGLSVVSASATLGSFDVATSSWNVGTLPPGASATLTVVTTAADAGTFVNEVQVASGTGAVTNPIVASATLRVTDGSLPTTGSSITGLAVKTALVLALVGAALHLATRRRRPARTA